MLDPARMDEVLRRGGDVATVVTAWRALDERRKKLQAELDGKRSARNAANERMSKLDKKSGQQWVPIISWEWRRYVTDDGTFKTDAKLEKQGFYDTGSILVNGQFSGCAPGKAIPEAVLKTPGVRYTFSNVVVVMCDADNMTLNYGKIRSSASW